MAEDSVMAEWADCENDSKVKEIAEWVIYQVNHTQKAYAQGKKLKLVTVLEGQVTVLTIGFLYRVLLEVKIDDGSLRRCQALVIVMLEGGKVLLEFHYVEINHEILGGWTDAGNDVGIEDMAKFAVDEYNKKEGTTLEFAKLKKAQKQILAGILYRLTLEAIDDGHKNLYQAMVFVKPWKKFKKLEDFKLLLLNIED